jgi:hypothetical protein
MLIRKQYLYSFNLPPVLLLQNILSFEIGFFLNNLNLSKNFFFEKNSTEISNRKKKY